MSIYGIGAYYEDDVSREFLDGNFIGIGWDYNNAPDLHEYIKTLKVGDIVYIKSWSPSSDNITIKGIGIITDNNIIKNNLVNIGRNVKWKDKNTFPLQKPLGKNNVRNNSLYEEFDTTIQAEIIKRL